MPPLPNAPASSSPEDAIEDREEVLRKFLSLLEAKSLQIPPVPQNDSGSTVPSVPADLDPSSANQLNIGKIGMTGIGVGHDIRKAHKLRKYLHADPSSPTGGAICSFPSLDLHSEAPEENGTDESQAPERPQLQPERPLRQSQRHSVPGDLATHMETDGEDDADTTSPQETKPDSGIDPGGGVKIPAMTACVFKVNDPQKQPRPHLHRTNSAEIVANANADVTVLELNAEKNLAKSTLWTRSSVYLAPMALLRSLSLSFSSLLESRVRAWSLVLVRHSLSSGDEQSRSRLLSLLATSHAIDLKAAVTTFQALKLPKGAVPEGQMKENEAVLPLIFEAAIDMAVQKMKVTVKLRAPGTITGTFASSEPLLTHANIQLDTNALVSSMVEQARLVVFKAVAKAAEIPDQQHPVVPIKPSVGAPKAQSAIDLSRAAVTARRQQMQSSQPLPAANTLSLKLNRPGQRPQQQLPVAAPGMNKKVRSVTWNHSVTECTTGTKAPSKSISVLKSSKSFGKPDANLFESSRNATFADFGRGQKPSHPTFVKGKLKMNAKSMAAMATIASYGSNGISEDDFATKKNAVFSEATMGIKNMNTGRDASKDLFMLTRNAALADNMRGMAGMGPTGAAGMMGVRAGSAASAGGSGLGLSGMGGSRTGSGLGLNALAASGKMGVSGGSGLALNMNVNAMGNPGLGNAGLRTAGSGDAGLAFSGRGNAGLGAAGMNAAGLGAAGMNAAGLNAAGMNAAGLNAAGLASPGRAMGGAGLTMGGAGLTMGGAGLTMGGAGLTNPGRAMGGAGLTNPGRAMGGAGLTNPGRGMGGAALNLDNANAATLAALNAGKSPFASYTRKTSAGINAGAAAAGMGMKRNNN